MIELQIYNSSNVEQWTWSKNTGVQVLFLTITSLLSNSGKYPLSGILVMICMSKNFAKLFVKSPGRILRNFHKIEKSMRMHSPVCNVLPNAHARLLKGFVHSTVLYAYIIYVISIRAQLIFSPLDQNVFQWYQTENF